MTTVLVVDDEADIRFLLRITLERAGYQVWEADNGRSLFEQLEQRTPDVLLLDLRMPRIDGWDVLARLQSDERLSGMHVIAASAHTSASARDRALALGCDAYVTKPFDLQHLLHTLETVAAAR